MTDSNSSSGSLGRDDAMLVLEQADLASQSGVPLAPGLRAMGAESRSKSVRRSLNQLADRLEAGEPLPSVLQTLRPGLSPMMEALISEGTGIGRYDTILHWAAEQGRRRSNLQWQLWGALAYPFFLLAVGMTIASFVLIGLAPRFKRIFEDFGTELPPLTMAIMWISDFAVNYWPIGLGLLVLLLLAAALIYFLTDTARPLALRFASSIPLVGAMFRLMSLADFCQLLSVLIEIRVPLDRAIRIAGRAVGDLWLQRASEHIAADIQQGHFSHSSAIEVGIPAAVGQLLSCASAPDALAESLQGLSEIYASRADVNSRFIAVVAEPLVMIITTVGLGAVVLGMLMPLIKLLNDLS